MRETLIYNKIKYFFKIPFLPFSSIPVRLHLFSASPDLSYQRAETLKIDWFYRKTLLSERTTFFNLHLCRSLLVFFDFASYFWLWFMYDSSASCDAIWSEIYNLLGFIFRNLLMLTSSLLKAQIFISFRTVIYPQLPSPNGWFKVDVGFSEHFESKLGRMFLNYAAIVLDLKKTSFYCCFVLVKVE